MIISSSAPVRSTKASIVAFTVAGVADRRAGQDLVEASRAPAAAGSRHSRRPAAAASPGLPVRRLTKACWSEVASSSASSSRLGGEGVEAEHHIGPVELRRGLEALAIDPDRLHHLRRARNARRRRRAGRASPPAGPEQARAEDPDRDVQPLARNGADGAAFLRARNSRSARRRRCGNWFSSEARLRRSA